MANAFNLVLKRVIFQELYVIGGDIIQFIPFVRAFYAFEFRLFHYSHCNRKNDVIIIPFVTGTCKSDLGEGGGVTIHFNPF